MDFPFPGTDIGRKADVIPELKFLFDTAPLFTTIPFFLKFSPPPKMSLFLQPLPQFVYLCVDTATTRAPLCCVLLHTGLIVKHTVHVTGEHRTGTQKMAIKADHR